MTDFDSHFLTPEPAPAEEPPFQDAPEAKPSERKKSPRVKVTPAVVRRVLERHDAVLGYEPQERALLSALLGTSEDAVDLTVATLTAGRSALAPAAELLEISSSDSPFAAMVGALSLERDTQRKAWALLVALGAAQGALPGKPDLAGARLAEVALALTPTSREALTRVKGLID